MMIILSVMISVFNLCSTTECVGCVIESTVIAPPGQ